MKLFDGAPPAPPMCMRAKLSYFTKAAALAALLSIDE
jgi:hypothetical protein